MDKNVKESISILNKIWRLTDSEFASFGDLALLEIKSEDLSIAKELAALLNQLHETKVQVLLTILHSPLEKEVLPFLEEHNSVEVPNDV